MAKKRQGRPDQPRSENFTEHTKGDTRDIVGDAIGMSGVTYERAKTVVQRADEGDPVAVEALAEMDDTGKVSPARTGGYRVIKLVDLATRHQSAAVMDRMVTPRAASGGRGNPPRPRGSRTRDAPLIC